MRRYLTFVLAAALALGAGSVVYANVCAVDQAPAATLLYPFVVLDYNNPVDGQTTLIAVTNVSSEAQIVHFTLWTDYSTHVLDWNVVLSGYDVQTMNIRDLLIDGLLPVTGTSGALVESGDVRVGGPGPDNTVPSGDPTDPAWQAAYGLPVPDSTATLASRCPSSGQYYPGNYTPIPGSTLALIQQWLQVSQTVVRGHIDCLTGDMYALGDWFEQRTTDDPTWMYITADVVWTCNGEFPDISATYWDSEAMTQNVLIGDLFYVSNADRLSEAMPAVHLEADLDLGAVTTPHPYTGTPMSFYMQYSAGADAREPLPQAWAARYIGRNDAAIGTSFRVFKRASANLWSAQTPGHTTDLLLLSGGGVAGPTDQPDMLFAWDCEPYVYYAWNEDEDVVQGAPLPPWSCPPGDPNCYLTGEPNLLPLETQEVSVDWFTAPDGSGWILFVWPFSNGVGYDVYQTYVSVKYNAYGMYSAAMQAAVMGNYACFSGQVLPILGINYDYVGVGGFNP